MPTAFSLSRVTKSPCLQSPLSECGEVLMNKLHGDRALAHRRCYPLHRSVAHIASHEDPWHTGLQQKRLPIFLPLRRQLAIPPQVRPRQNESLLVPQNRVGYPLRARRRANEHKETFGANLLVSVRSVKP